MSPSTDEMHSWSSSFWAQLDILFVLHFILISSNNSVILYPLCSVSSTDIYFLTSYTRRLFLYYTSPTISYLLWCILCVPIQALTYPARYLTYQTPSPLLHLSYTSLSVMVYPVCFDPGTDIPCPLPHTPDRFSSTPPLLLFLVCYGAPCVFRSRHWHTLSCTSYTRHLHLLLYSTTPTLPCMFKVPDVDLHRLQVHVPDTSIFPTLLYLVYSSNLISNPIVIMYPCMCYGGEIGLMLRYWWDWYYLIHI